MNAEQLQPSNATTKGGWTTFPFLIVTMGAMTLAAGGWSTNMVVYLIDEFNVKSIDAAQISNVVHGSMNLLPILGAILADSFFGPFIVILVSCVVSLVGTILLTLTTTLESLKPIPCETGSSDCIGPSKFQLSIMYLSLTLASIGVGGTRYTLAALGADQFTKPRHHGVFFNWFFCAMYIGTLGSLVGTIYIEDNVSWGLGFGLCVAANLIGLVVLVSGKPYYRLVKQQGSPFTRLACVLVASFCKRNVLLSLKSEDYCQEPVNGGIELVGSTPTNSFKFLNHAALLTEGDTNTDVSIKKPWKLCTLKQVEDLKTLIRILPIWSAGIALHTPIVTQTSLIVLQALSMDRHIGPHFQIPASTMLVFVVIATATSLALIDRFIIPTFQKLTCTSATLLKRIGFGHILTISSMGISAIVESRRLARARTHNLHGNSVVPMSALWIVPQLVVVGVGEAFMFPGQVSLYYQEFPKSLKSTSAAMLSLLLGIAFYLGTAVIDVLKNTTGWLPDGINDGRMDNVYWVLAILGLINFGYFLVCSYLYKYQNTENEELASNDPF